MDLYRFIRDVPDFPKPGIIFRDITPILASPEALKASVDGLAERLGDRKIDKIVGIESRGFLFGAPLAIQLGVGFIPVRKPNKLPWKTQSVDYDLEYGQDSLEIHEDALQRGDRIAIVDDLLATGGTAKATTVLTQGLGAHIESMLFVVELGFLGGRQKLEGFDVQALITYD